MKRNYIKELSKLRKELPKSKIRRLEREAGKVYNNVVDGLINYGITQSEFTYYYIKGEMKTFINSECVK